MPLAAITTASVPAAPVTLRPLAPGDIRASLREGWRDFRAAPTQLGFLCLLYPAIALVFARFAAGGALFPLLFPVASGFALVAPVAAVGLHEISRRRERGMAVRAADVFRVREAPGFGAVLALGAFLLAVFVLWLVVAEALLGLCLGATAFATPADFLDALFGTVGGWTLIVVGNAAGFVFATIVLAVATFAIPLALDRAIGPLDAARASVAAARAQPAVLARWGLAVALGLFAGSIPAFIGLAVALPVLGHANWHLYRRASGGGR